LSAKGRLSMKGVRSTIRGLVGSFDTVAASPLVRARETADLLCGRNRRCRRLETAKLRPGVHPRELKRWLDSNALPGVTVLVGHQPDLGCFLSYVLTGSMNHSFDIKKGGFAL